MSPDGLDAPRPDGILPELPAPRDPPIDRPGVALPP